MILFQFTKAMLTYVPSSIECLGLVNLKLYLNECLLIS